MAAAYGLRSEVETLLVDHEDIMTTLSDYAKVKCDPAAEIPIDFDANFMRKMKSKLTRMRSQMLAIINE